MSQPLEYCLEYKQHCGMMIPDCHNCKYEKGCPKTSGYTRNEDIFPMFKYLIEEIENLKHEVATLKNENYVTDSCELFD